MARVSGTASLGIKKSLGHKKGWNQYDSASPHYSMTIERNVSEDLTDKELEEKALQLIEMCQQRVEKKISDDLKDLNKVED